MKKTVQILLFSLSIYQLSFAQIEISFPKNRIVFQRNNQNNTTFSVAGSIKTAIDKIEARLVPVKNGQGEATNWTTIETNPANSSFNGKITGSGGWYKLEVRAYYDNKFVAESSIERVGIGEVFIISGQSNAQGDYLYEGSTLGTTEDRVSVINYYDAILDENKLPFEFSQMGANTKMAPYHYVPYLWSKLGEMLVEKYNVPILFYGTALGGIGSNPWRRSAAGEDLRKELSTFISVPGMPYRAMKAALNLYASRTGVRSIIWLQGESDSKSSTQQYYDNMKYVIDKTRTDLNKPDLAWMIARNTVSEAQNLLINSVPNTFEGPDTDLINGPDLRYIGHFAGLGLWAVARAYMDYLNESFFMNTNPHLPNFIQTISSICNTSNGTITIGVPAGFKQYNWSNNATTQSINLNNTEGVYSAKMTDNQGNISVSSAFYLPKNYYYQNGFISIKPNGKTEFCEGNPIDLESNASNIYKFNWNNGLRQPNITVGKTGTYFASGSSIVGCSFTTNQIPVNVFPKPAKPTIAAQGKTTFCKGDNVILNASNALQYSWNNGQTTNQINVNQAGDYSVKIIDTKGCVSDESNKIVVKLLPQPNPPLIYAVPDTIACQGTEISLLNRLNEALYWNNSAEANFIKVRQDGLYTARNKNTSGCFSEFAKPINLSFKATPNISELNQIGSYSLQPKILNDIKPTKYNWYYEGQLLQTETSILKTNKDGAYTVKAFKLYNNLLWCSSEISNSYILANRNAFENQLSLYPNPTLDGKVILETAENRTNVSFEIIRANGAKQNSYYFGDLKDKTTIDLSTFGKGFYIIKIHSNEGSQVKRVLYN